MDYYVQPRHLYSHSRTCTRSGLCRRLSLIVPVFMIFQLSWLDSSICQTFLAIMEILIHYISSAIMEIMVLCISSSFWFMYIVLGDDHLCDILYHAYSRPLYSYVSRTAICICIYVQSCIIVLCWLGGWSSIWDSSSLHFWDGLIVFRPSYDPSDLTH